MPCTDLLCIVVLVAHKADKLSIGLLSPTLVLHQLCCLVTVSHSSTEVNAMHCARLEEAFCHQVFRKLHKMALTP